MTSSVFPDINVWVAMASTVHFHHVAARRWYDALDDGQELIFCRFTQLGLLRLLTQVPIMGEQVMNQREAWGIYDRFLLDGNARMMVEPRLLDQHFRRFAALETPSPNDWADSYLAAFAEAAGLVLVTFDKKLAGRSHGSILLNA